MKYLISSFAVALAGALSLVLPARSKTPEASTREAVHLRVDVDRGVLPAGAVERAIVKIAINGAVMPRRELRPPVNLALVIDRSGSMAGDKIDQAREAALEAVSLLAPDDIVSLVAYDTEAETLVRADRVGDARRLKHAIRGLRARGDTALYAGVIRGAAEIRRNMNDGRFVNRVILLSDGQANQGPSTPEELGRLGHSLMKEGISVTTVGLGLGYNEDLMTRLAQRSDGNTYFVENSADLTRIFAAELGDVLNVVARRVVIEIDFPEGVRPIAFVGRDGVIRGQQAQLTLNQVYGGQEKFALVEVEVSGGVAGSECEIARARINYDDAVNRRATTLTAKRSIQFSTSASSVVASADHQVQADYAANVMAVAKDQAVALVDENRKEEAAELLRDRTRELEKVAVQYSNAAVAGVAAAAAPEADRVAHEGISNAKRKSYRADSAQIRAQQSSGRP